ncbi:MAG: pyridoxal-phosphate-dependent aminotransferase family protein [Acidimicrobiales bacterium]
MTSHPRHRALGWGRHQLAIPGPSVMPDRVLAAMATPMPNIYAGDLVEVSNRCLERLPPIARTDGHVFVTVGNGHGGWQMALANTLSRGDTVLVAESGRFAAAWGQMAAIGGLEIETLPGTDRDPVDPDALRDRLAADTGGRIRAVLAVQTDTASSVRNDVAALRAALDDAGHDALLMIDCIASMGCDPYEMDAWGVDVTVAASQKGLMTPPGLAFVWAGPKAMAAHESAELRDGYTDWTSRINSQAHYQLYAGTPPVSHLYALHEALELIAEEGGLDAVWERHRVHAEAVWAAVDAWGSDGGRLTPNIAEPAQRSWAVTTVRCEGVDPDEIRARAEGLGLTLGLGIAAGGGPFGTSGTFRIGHMGHLNPPMLLGALATLDAVLGGMGVAEAGVGIAAASASLAAHLSSD